MPLTRTTIATDIDRNRQAGTDVLIPGEQGISIPAGLRAVQVELTLSSADKLSVGKAIELRAFVSPDRVVWSFLNGMTWQSYGPGGLTVTAPDGEVQVNPDPRLMIPVANLAGQFLRVMAMPITPIRAGFQVGSF